jgi:hypothetical protein
MPSLKHKRGTRAQIAASAAASGLKAGEVYLISDEARLTVGTAANAHVPAAKQSEIDVVAAFAGANTGGVVSGQYYDNGFNAATQSLLAGVAGQMDLAPYFSRTTMPIDRIGCAVTTGVVGALFKIVIYSSNAQGWPDAKLYESADLSAAAVAFAEATLSFTFQANTCYWVGVRKSSTATLRTVPIAAAANLGLLRPIPRRRPPIGIL